MADIRVTQAGRQAATQEEPEVRVTQAGRQAATQEAADVRVTQAGRQAATQQTDADLRVTMLGRQVLITEPSPTAPNVIIPYTDQVVSETLWITYDESIDPLGGTIWYTARYKKDTDTAWTAIFTDALYNSIFELDVTGDADGDYTFQIWAETAGYSSQITSIDFVIHNGRPTAPTITAPYEGQQWQKTSNTVEWDAATDPDDDSLTYDARYKKVSASSWTSLFTGETGLSYLWNQAAFDVDDYELEIWANDGVGDGPADHVYFSIFIANQPISPRIRIVEIGADYVTVELEEYDHPNSLAWQATKWEIMPFGGSWANPVESTTTTDSAEQLLYTFQNLAPGFRGVIRATFQDASNNWGDPSAEVMAAIPGTTTDWERRWERNAAWYLRGLGIQGRAGDWGDGLHEQPISAIVDPDAESMGSFKMSGYVMAGGCYCGWIGRDTELRRLGIGVFQGDSERGGEYGVFFGIEFGVTTSGITGAHNVRPFMYAKFESCPAYGNAKAYYGDSFVGYSSVTAGIQPLYGQPIGPWVSLWTHRPIYFLELWVQRNVSTNTARLRGRINYAGYVSEDFGAGVVYEKHTASDEWDIDQTVTCLTECGRPGFYQGQYAYGWPSAYGEYFGLRYTALRDEGQTYVQNVDPLTPYQEPPAGACTPVSEDAPSTPVFFPAPPNGDVEEDWVHPSDLIQARDDTEQRISLRDIPVERIRFTTTLPTAREVGQLHALIWEEQPSRWGVPLWMDAARLDVDLTSGSSSIPAASVDTDGRRFDEATYVAIWKDQFTWDFLPCTYNADGSITLTGSTSRTYYAYETYVIPCRIGRMGPTAEFDRSSPEIGDLEVTFVLEAVDG